MSNVIPMKDPLTHAGERYDSAYARTKHGRDEWIEGSLEMAQALVDARHLFKSDNNGFSEWLVKNKRDQFNDHDRAALIGLGGDLNLARTVLEKTARNSYKHIWAEVKGSFPVKKGVVHADKTPANRQNTPKTPKAPSNNPPSGPRPWNERNALFKLKLPRGKEINAEFLNKNAAWGIANVVSKHGGREVWDMMVKCYDAGFIRQTRYYPNGDHDPCTMRLLFPSSPKGFTGSFDMANARQRRYVRDRIIPAALAHREALLANPERLEEIVNKATGLGDNDDAGPDVATITQRPVERSAPIERVAAPRPIGHGKYLSPQEVDPEFTGTPMEFTDKYGHVQTQTAEQMATARFNDLTSHVRALAKRWKELPELGRELDINWLRSPEQRDVDRMTEALEFLEPLMAKARAALDQAVAALKKKAE